MKLSSCAIKNEEYPALSTEACRLDTHSLDPFAPQAVEVHLILGVSSEIGWLCAARIDLVLKVGSFLDNRCQFILRGSCQFQVFNVTGCGAHLAEDLFLLVFFELWDRLFQEKPRLVGCGRHISAKDSQLLWKLGVYAQVTIQRRKKLLYPALFLVPQIEGCNPWPLA